MPRWPPRRDYQLVGAETRLLQANGVNTDAELALFEADHGDPAQAVDLAARAWAAAPSVRSADAYSWALSAAGRDGEALAHVGAGDAARLARSLLPLPRRDGRPARRPTRSGRRDSSRQLVAQSPRFNPLYGPRAERALEGLR